VASYCFCVSPFLISHLALLSTRSDALSFPNFAASVPFRCCLPFRLVPFAPGSLCVVSPHLHHRGCFLSPIFLFAVACDSILPRSPLCIASVLFFLSPTFLFDHALGESVGWPPPDLMFSRLRATKYSRFLHCFWWWPSFRAGAIWLLYIRSIFLIGFVSGPSPRWPFPHVDPYRGLQPSAFHPHCLLGWCVL